jgi:hypothetical protein
MIDGRSAPRVVRTMPNVKRLTQETAKRARRLNILKVLGAG